MQSTDLQQSVGPYLIELKIGSGQYGQVYLAKHKETSQEVAIKEINFKKILNPKAIELVDNEIIILQTCDSPYIVKLLQYERTADFLYLVLEYCNEGDLSLYLDEKGTIEESQAVEFLRQIVSAFKVLTQQNIIHRDLKLQNIFKHNGSIKIGDFGLSKLLQSQVMAKTTLGTPLNMAPEMFLASTYSNKIDIWAIGVVFYEMLFGFHPFQALDFTELIEKQRKSVTFPDKIKVCDETKELIQRMLVPDPEKRIGWEELFRGVCALSSKFTKESYSFELIKEVKEPEHIFFNDSYWDNLVMTKFDDNETTVWGVDLIKSYETLTSSLDSFMLTSVEYKKYIEPVLETQIEPVEQEKDTGWTVLTKDGFSAENKFRVIKQNINKLLFERNKCILLALAAEDVTRLKLDLNEYVSYILTKEAAAGLQFLYASLVKRDNILKLDKWSSLINTKVYDDLKVSIRDDWKTAEEKLIAKEAQLKQLKRFDPRITTSFMVVLNENVTESIEDRDLIKKVYVKTITDALENEKEIVNSHLWVHLDLMLSAFSINEINDNMMRGKEIKSSFTWHHYPNLTNKEEFKKHIQNKFKSFLSRYF